MHYVIRELQENEKILLNDFLYEAIYVPDGTALPSKVIINKPELQVYLSDFGEEKDDLCI